MSFDSLYTGITGLNAYQSWIDMISNNIANVDTTAFKSQSMTFADLFYQNQGFATGPTTTNGGINPQQIGVGVKVNSIDTLFAQGGLQNTGVPTDLAINGDGFFVLNNLNGTATPTYTRDGNFRLNSNGVMVDPATGLAVQGWTANSSGVVTTGGATGNITIPVGLQEQATATGAGTKVGPSSADQVFDVALGGNLDQTQWQQAFLQSVGAQATNGAPYTITTTMYDSLGNAHQAEITYVPDATGAVNATFTSAGNNCTSNVSLAPATSQNDAITVSVVGNGTTVSVTDQYGVNMTVNAGSSATVDGTTFTVNNGLVAGNTETINVTAAQSGLPSVVQNASGTSVTPATRWKVDVTFTDGTLFSTINQPGAMVNGVVTTPTTFSTGSSGTLGYAYFDQNGQFINSSSIETATGAQGIAGNGATGYLHTTGGNPSIQEGDQLNVTLWGQSSGNAASAPTAGGAAPTAGPIGLDYAGNAAGAGLASLAGAYSANVLSQNGYAAGVLDNLTIGADGKIQGIFFKDKLEAKNP